MTLARCTILMAAMLLSSAAASAAENAEKRPLELASPFVDGAILQRGMTVPVWGWAAPGNRITVAFAGQSKTATADNMGKWMVKLDALKASLGERDLAVTSSTGQSLTCKGVLVGEVWFASGFEKERDELNLLYPNTDVCKAAVTGYIETLKQYNREVVALREAGKELPEQWAEKLPSFPQPYYNEWAETTETATRTCNFCVSPLTPFAVRGVVWIPGKDNIGKDVSKYPAALKTYAASCAKTYGQDKVAFVFAQPSAELVEGMTQTAIENSMSIEFNEWPKSLREIAAKLGALAAGGGRD